MPLDDEEFRTIASKRDALGAPTASQPRTSRYSAA